MVNLLRMSHTRHQGANSRHPLAGSHSSGVMSPYKLPRNGLKHDHYATPVRHAHFLLDFGCLQSSHLNVWESIRCNFIAFNEI
jgi:hypothetical protein